MTTTATTPSQTNDATVNFIVALALAAGDDSLRVVPTACSPGIPAARARMTGRGTISWDCGRTAVSAQYALCGYARIWRKRAEPLEVPAPEAAEWLKRDPSRRARRHGGFVYRWNQDLVNGLEFRDELKGETNWSASSLYNDCLLEIGVGEKWEDVTEEVLWAKGLVADDE